MTRRIHIALFATLALLSGHAEAAQTYLGPLTVRVSERANDGKTTPVKHIPVWLNARNADADTNGVATFDGVPAGRHTLKLRLPDYVAVPTSAGATFAGS